MMGMARTCVAGVLLIASQSATLAGHHAFSAVYDAKKTIEVEGVVTEFRFVNPHAMMLMKVKNKAGKVETWTVEFPGPLNLREGGWTAQSIKPGERLKVIGNPAWKSATQMAFQKIVRADGTELLGTGAKRLESIEQERRDRAAKRGQGK